MTRYNLSYEKGILSACPEYENSRSKSPLGMQPLYILQHLSFLALNVLPHLGRIVSALTTVLNVSRRSPYVNLPDAVQYVTTIIPSLDSNFIGVGEGH